MCIVVFCGCGTPIPYGTEALKDVETSGLGWI
jgi:hypothetical protein